MKEQSYILENNNSVALRFNRRALRPSYSLVREYKNIQSLDVDKDIQQLSSRKLWQILTLNQLKGCELDKDFIERIKAELIARDDFDNGQAWCEPH